MGAIKLGIAVGVGYALGGKLGNAALVAVAPNADTQARVGAAWAGRVVTFAGILWVLR